MNMKQSPAEPIFNLNSTRVHVTHKMETEHNYMYRLAIITAIGDDGNNNKKKKNLAQNYIYIPSVAVCNSKNTKFAFYFANPIHSSPKYTDHFALFARMSVQRLKSHDH